VQGRSSGWDEAFTNKGEILIQKDGLAMGAPTSGLIAEFFLQNLENTHLTALADKHKIIKYLRYVDDILLIYFSDHTDTQKILDDFNTLHPKLSFTAEAESDNKINYLDVTSHRTPIRWKTAIYRKPTFITNLFRKTDLKVALRTNNTIQSLLMHKQQTPDKCSQSWVYKLTCPDCSKAYVGRTEASERGLLNTEMHIDLTTALLILPHTSLRNHIHLAQYTTQFKF
jgi:hypothetical protein